MSISQPDRTVPLPTPSAAVSSKNLANLSETDVTTDRARHTMRIRNSLEQRLALARGLARLPSVGNARSGATCSLEIDVQWRSRGRGHSLCSIPYDYPVFH